jgi:hypothetical protein
MFSGLTFGGRTTHGSNRWRACKSVAELCGHGVFRGENSRSANTTSKSSLTPPRESGSPFAHIRTWNIISKIEPIELLQPAHLKASPQPIPSSNRQHTYDVMLSSGFRHPQKVYYSRDFFIFAGAIHIGKI